MDADRDRADLDHGHHRLDRGHQRPGERRHLHAVGVGGPAGYTAGAWSCDAGTLTGASLVLPNGVSATCTINNDDQAATLTLVKTVTNDNGGTAAADRWTLTATGPTTDHRRHRLTTVTNAPVNAGTYTLSESGGRPGTPPGDWSCTAGHADRASARVAERRERDVHDQQRRSGRDADPGEDGDERQRRHGRPTAWTLAATGPTPITGATGSAAVTNAPVNAGTYTLSRVGRTGRVHRGGLVVCAGILTGRFAGVAERCERDVHDQQRRSGRRR